MRSDDPPRPQTLDGPPAGPVAPARIPARGSRVLRPVPNLLSALRLLLGVVFPVAPPAWQAWLIGLAAGTDYVDGRLARAIGATGVLGKYLDPAADKVFVAAVLATLVVRGPLLPTDLALLLVRDVVVLVGTAGLLVARRPDLVARLGPSPLGKATTWALFAYLLLVVCGRDRLPAALGVVGGLGALAALDYVRRGFRAPSARSDRVNPTENRTCPTRNRS